LLLIDDVQFIAGKDSTQEEFFHTMNEIITAGRRLVITSDRAPQDLDGIAPRILSRLSWGLVADINQADYELRFNIIIAKLETLPGVEMPRRWSTSRPPSDLVHPELEGALNRIGAYAMMTGRVIDVAFVEEVLPTSFAPTSAYLDRRNPDPGGRALPHPQGRDDLCAQGPRGRPAAPGRDVSIQAADTQVAAGHRPALRRARPYDRDPRGSPDREVAGERCRARRRHPAADAPAGGLGRQADEFRLPRQPKGKARPIVRPGLSIPLQ
jgi:hypothetical protein